jgi:excisionase family DNA binding protein
MPLCYSVRTAAAELTVTERTIHNAIRDGKLKTVRIGRRVLIPAKYLQEFLNAKGHPSSKETVAK